MRKAAALASAPARLLLREITPHRDRNDNCSGYNQSTDNIFHFAPPTNNPMHKLTPMPSLMASSRKRLAVTAVRSYFDDDPNLLLWLEPV